MSPRITHIKVTRFEKRAPGWRGIAGEVVRGGLEHLCALIGHPFGCALANNRVFWWAFDRSAHKWTRWEDQTTTPGPYT